MALFDRFPGGLTLDGHKADTERIPIRTAPIPERLILPLAQHVGQPSAPVISPGSRVRKGEVLARAAGYVSAALHAPTSGRVRDIGVHAVIHPGGLRLPCIEIEPDGEDRSVERAVIDKPFDLEPAVVHELIQRHGIVGFGGAGFPTHVKVREGTAHTVDTLIINGAECEPYITCDNRLLQERAAEIIAGTRILAHAVQASHSVIAIEDDMRAARAALAPACDAAGIELTLVPARYPTGGEKQLIKVLTGREVPSGGLPIQIGIVVQNVATAAAVYRAIHLGEPVTSRVLTLAGALPAPGNVEALLGTPVSALLAFAGLAPGGGMRVLSGGPMMGVRVADWSAPITKVTNCLLVEPDVARPAARACIRCGECVTACPAGLQPQALYEFAKVSDFDAAQDYHLFDCIECGCCAYVCPSQIPLVQYYRYAKSAIEGLDEEFARAQLLRARFERHELRAARLERGVLQAPIDAPDSDAEIRAEIAAAVARSRERHGSAEQ
jgi:electron transport complex protein RnfC